MLAKHFMPSIDVVYTTRYVCTIYNETILFIHMLGILELKPSYIVQVTEVSQKNFLLFFVFSIRQIFI